MELGFLSKKVLVSGAIVFACIAVAQWTFTSGVIRTGSLTGAAGSICGLSCYGRPDCGCKDGEECNMVRNADYFNPDGSINEERLIELNADSNQCYLSLNCTCVPCKEDEVWNPDLKRCQQDTACLGVVCDAPDSCTTARCVEGQCEFTPKDCGQGDQCTDRYCNPSTPNGCVADPIDCPDTDHPCKLNPGECNVENGCEYPNKVCNDPPDSCHLTNGICTPVDIDDYSAGDCVYFKNCPNQPDCPEAEYLGCHSAVGCLWDNAKCDPTCGDGKVNTPDEQCDDGNDNNNDDCTNNCQFNECKQWRLAHPGETLNDCPKDVDNNQCLYLRQKCDLDICCSPQKKVVPPPDMDCCSPTKCIDNECIQCTSHTDCLGQPSMFGIPTNNCISQQDFENQVEQCEEPNGIPCKCNAGTCWGDHTFTITECGSSAGGPSTNPPPPPPPPGSANSAVSLGPNSLSSTPQSSSASTSDDGTDDPDAGDDGDDDPDGDEDGSSLSNSASSPSSSPSSSSSSSSSSSASADSSASEEDDDPDDGADDSDDADDIDDQSEDEDGDDDGGDSDDSTDENDTDTTTDSGGGDTDDGEESSSSSSSYAQCDFCPACTACQRCGIGLGNICDERECNGLGICVFQDGIFSNVCLPDPQICSVCES